MRRTFRAILSEALTSFFDVDVRAGDDQHELEEDEARLGDPHLDVDNPIRHTVLAHVSLRSATSPRRNASDLNLARFRVRGRVACGRCDGPRQTRRLSYGSL
jgi:hypothetical protein